MRQGGRFLLERFYLFDYDMLCYHTRYKTILDYNIKTGLFVLERYASNISLVKLPAIKILGVLSNFVRLIYIHAPNYRKARSR